MPSAASSGSATSGKIDPDAFKTDSCQALQNEKQRAILDIVDRLRQTGLNGTIALPQLVTVGDQSSGKSSVLEALTEIEFPRGEFQTPEVFLVSSLI